MKVIGLNKKEYVINLKNYIKPRTSCSKYHEQARSLLQKMFCGYQLYEEVKLPGTVDPAKKSVLRIDFFIPNAILCVEVHGEQHYKYIPYFHKSIGGFLKSKARDSLKKEWCEINKLRLAELKWDDGIEKWREQIDNIR